MERAGGVCAELTDWDVIASQLREKVGARTGAPVDAYALARALLGRNAVTFSDDIPGSAYLRPCVEGGFQIVLRPGPDVDFRILHQLGHFLIRKRFPGRVFSFEDEETFATGLAGSLLGSGGRSSAAVDAHIHAIARAFGLSPARMLRGLRAALAEERGAVVGLRSHSKLARTRGATEPPPNKLSAGQRR